MGARQRQQNNDVVIESADAKTGRGPASVDPTAKPRDTRSVVALRGGGDDHDRFDQYGRRAHSSPPQ